MESINAINTLVVEERFPLLFEDLGKMKDEYKIILRGDAIPYKLSRPRNIPLALWDKVKQELERMQRLTIISPMNEFCEWCAPLVVVIKKNGELRLCVDYTELNKSVQRENYPLPNIDYMLGQISGSKYFSKLDLNSAYWQLPLSEDSKKLTCFITPFGRFIFNRLPFGLCSAPERYQRTVADILHGIDNCHCLLDDIFVFGATQQQHDETLNNVLTRLSNAGVTLNRDKCEFFVTEINFVGHVISDKGIRPDPSKVEAIVKMPAPTNLTELRRFLGMVTYLGKFLPNSSTMTSQLRELLHKDEEWSWGKDQQVAFDNIKQLCVSADILAMYDPNKETQVSCDASMHGLGACLLQKHGEIWRPVFYASTSLSGAETRYPTIEREGLGVIWACERFKDFLIGKQFTILTDHAPLVSLFGKKVLDELTPRLQRFKIRLMRFDYTIQHVPGKSLVIADMLSRAPCGGGDVLDSEFKESVDVFIGAVVDNLPVSDNKLTEIRNQLNKDVTCSLVMRYITTEWPKPKAIGAELKPYFSVRDQLSIFKGLLLFNTRLVIPSSMRGEMLKRIHDGHCGIVKCRERAKMSVWWPNISKQIEQLTSNCVVCVTNNVQKHEPMIPSKRPVGPWQKVGSDLFEYEGKIYAVAIDYFSKWIEASPLVDATTTTVINFFSYLMSRYGNVLELFTDNGPCYISREFKKFCEQIKCSHVTSSPLYPQSNGQSEAAVKIVKSLLKKNNGDLLKSILVYNSTPTASGYSPAELFLGRRLNTNIPTDPRLLRPSWPKWSKVHQSQKQCQMRQKRHYDRAHAAKTLSPLSIGEHVYIKEGKKRTPAQVVQINNNPRSFLVRTATGYVRRNRFALIRLPQQPYFNNGEVEPDDVECSETIIARDNSGTPEHAGSETSISTRSGRTVHRPVRLIEEI